MTTSNPTAGRQLATELRKVFTLSPRTRWYRKTERKGNDAESVSCQELTRRAVCEEIWRATCQPAAYPAGDSERIARLTVGYHAMLGWERCIESSRSHPVLCWKLKELTPWQFTAYLGRMVDTGITGGADFEDWFRRERDRLVPSGHPVPNFVATALRDA